MNVGNFAFWSAAHKLVGGRKILVPFGAKADDFKGKIDLLLIPAANWLNQRQDFGWLADLIEGLSIPVAILGLGAQSDSDDDYPPLKEGTIRFLKAASNATPFLAVRGKYTERLCRHYGIENVRPLGCPSILLNEEAALGFDIENRWGKDVEKLVVHSLNIKPYSTAAEKLLLNWLTVNKGGGLVIQAPREFVMLLVGEEFPEPSRQLLEQTLRILDSDMSANELKMLIQRFGYIPFSADAWIFHLGFFSHSVNTRIHGTVMSLMAGVPSICCIHDTRTKELCESLLIPSIEIKSSNQFETPEQLFDTVKFNGNDFNENRQFLRKENIRLLREAGFPER